MILIYIGHLLIKCWDSLSLNLSPFSSANWYTCFMVT